MGKLYWPLLGLGTGLFLYRILALGATRPLLLVVGLAGALTSLALALFLYRYAIEYQRYLARPAQLLALAGGGFLAGSAAYWFEVAGSHLITQVTGLRLSTYVLGTALAPGVEECAKLAGALLLWRLLGLSRQALPYVAVVVGVGFGTVENWLYNVSYASTLAGEIIYRLLNAFDHGAYTGLAAWGVVLALRATTRPRRILGALGAVLLGIGLHTLQNGIVAYLPVGAWVGVHLGVLVVVYVLHTRRLRIRRQNRIEVA